MPPKPQDFVIVAIVAAIVIILVWNATLTDRVDKLSQLVDSLLKKPYIKAPAGKMIAAYPTNPRDCVTPSGTEVPNGHGVVICYGECSWTYYICLDGNLVEVESGECLGGTRCDWGSNPQGRISGRDVLPEDICRDTLGGSSCVTNCNDGDLESSCISDCTFSGWICINNKWVFDGYFSCDSNKQCNSETNECEETGDGSTPCLIHTTTTTTTTTITIPPYPTTTTTTTPSTTTTTIPSTTTTGGNPSCDGPSDCHDVSSVVRQEGCCDLVATVYCVLRNGECITTGGESHWVCQCTTTTTTTTTSTSTSTSSSTSSTVPGYPE